MATKTDQIIRNLAALEDPYDADTGLCLLCDRGSETSLHTPDCPYKMAKDVIASPASLSMPTVADAIYRASAMLEPILPPNFYGTVSLIYEDGKPLRFKKDESIKL